MGPRLYLRGLSAFRPAEATRQIVLHFIRSPTMSDRMAVTIISRARLALPPLSTPWEIRSLSWSIPLNLKKRFSSPRSHFYWDRACPHGISFRHRILARLSGRRLFNSHGGLGLGRLRFRQVVDLRESDSTDASTTYAAVVEFIDERRQKRKFVDSFSSSPPSYHTGQTVGVLYNRENPGEAQIDRGRMNYWLPFLFGSLGTLFTTAGVFTARKDLRRRRNALRFRKTVC